MEEATSTRPGIYPSPFSLRGPERWYVVRTLAQRERLAGKQLDNQGFRVFIPHCWKNRRHARRVETVSLPLFPRYIFVILDRGRDRWRSINGTLGVERLLMQSGEPQPVPVGVVESLISAADEDGHVSFGFVLQEGETVRITAGPFANFVGHLESLDEKGRVKVLLGLMGGDVGVTLSQAMVVPTRAMV
jgi:transcription antitermination factor NusG